MKLYHGSFVEIKKPDVLHSRKNVDFGAGFYVTTMYEQSAKWAKRFRHSGKQAVVSCYDFDQKELQNLKVMKFDTYSEEWLDFIVTCRHGEDNSDYDIVIGGIANDRVFNTLELFFDNLIDKTEAIKRLKYEKPNVQICFRNQRIIDNYLRFEKSETL